MTLKELIAATGRTQNEIAADAGISTQYLSALATGERRDPVISILRRLAKALGVSDAVALAALTGTANEADAESVPRCACSAR